MAPLGNRMECQIIWKSFLVEVVEGKIKFITPVLKLFIGQNLLQKNYLHSKRL